MPNSDLSTPCCSMDTAKLLGSRRAVTHAGAAGRLLLAYLEV